MGGRETKELCTRVDGRETTDNQAPHAHGTHTYGRCSTKVQLSLVYEPCLVQVTYQNILTLTNRGRLPPLVPVRREDEELKGYEIGSRIEGIWGEEGGFGLEGVWVESIGRISYRREGGGSGSEQRQGNG